MLAYIVFFSFFCIVLGEPNVTLISGQTYAIKHVNCSGNPVSININMHTTNGPANWLVYLDGDCQTYSSVLSYINTYSIQQIQNFANTSMCFKIQNSNSGQSNTIFYIFNKICSTNSGSSSAGSSIVSSTADSVISSTGNSIVSSTGNSVISSTSNSVISSTGNSVMSSTGSENTSSTASLPQTSSSSSNFGNVILGVVLGSIGAIIIAIITVIAKVCFPKKQQINLIITGEQINMANSRKNSKNIVNTDEMPDNSV